DVFQLIRSGNAEISQELSNHLLACSDVLEQMIDDVESGGDTSSKNPDEQVHALKTWLGARGGQTAKTDHHAPSAAVLTIDHLPEETELPQETGGLPEY